MSSTVTTVRPTVNIFPIKQLASRCVEPLLLVSIRSFFSNFDRIFFIFHSNELIGQIRLKKLGMYSPELNAQSNRMAIWLDSLFYLKSISINADVIFARLKFNIYWIKWCYVSFEFQWLMSAILYFVQNLFSYLLFFLSIASVVV